MKAVIFSQCGKPEEVLQIQDVPKPSPARGEVLVRMIASPVNPSDLMYISGKYTFQPNLPATPGFEGVGVVEASGGGLLGWLRKGKRVAVLNDRRGNWSEYTVTMAKQVIPVPDDIPDDQAASFFVNPATAVAMTKHMLKIPPGERLLQTAAGSTLGKMIIRLGKTQGFRTINVVRRHEQIDELKKLGADEVMVESDGPLPEQLKSKSIPDLRFAVDCVGGETGSQAAACLSNGGRMLVYGTLSGDSLKLDPRRLITTGACIEGFWLGQWAKQLSIPQKLRLIRSVRALFRDGTARCDIAKTYPLAEVRAAVAHAAASGKGGKIQLRIGS